MTPTQQLADMDTEKDILSIMLYKPDQTIPKVKAELTKRFNVPIRINDLGQIPA